MLCRFFCNIGLLWFPGKKSCIIKVKDKELKIHRYWLPGRLLCSIRSNRKWCKRRGSSLECQNCFFVYPIIDSNLTNLFFLIFLQHLIQLRQILRNLHFQLMQIRHNLLCRWILYRYIFHFFILVNGKIIFIVNDILLFYKK